MKNIWALSSVVLKESIRRKDFYVLFVVTALITLMMGSVNLFHDSQIDRYLKEICLLLIWISSLVQCASPAREDKGNLTWPVATDSTTNMKGSDALPSKPATTP